MPVPLPRLRAVMLVLALASAALAVLASSAMASNDRGVLYTQTNDPSGNTVQRFERGRDGTIAPAGTFSTGGPGPPGTFSPGGRGLAPLGGRQGAVELSGDGRYLYAVNAGSDSVSVF